MKMMTVLGHKSATRIYTKGAKQTRLAEGAVTELEEQMRNKPFPTRSFKFGQLPKRTGNTAG
jgi:hypothetical protein